MLTKKKVYEYLINLSQIKLLDLVSDVVQYYKLPKDEHTPIVFYQYETYDDFIEHCSSFNVDSTVSGIQDVHWIKPILTTLSNYPDHFIIKNADQVCISFHGLEIVQFKNTSDNTKSHRLVIKYELLQSKILREIAKQPSYAENFVTLSGLSFLTLCIGFSAYTLIKKML